jgi:hypothetical protein
LCKAKQVVELPGTALINQELCPNLHPVLEFDMKQIVGLDKGIAKAEEVLRQNGIETFESCQGGKGTRFLSLQ